MSPKIEPTVATTVPLRMPNTMAAMNSPLVCLLLALKVRTAPTTEMTHVTRKVTPIETKVYMKICINVSTLTLVVESLAASVAMSLNRFVMTGVPNRSMTTPAIKKPTAAVISSMPPISRRILDALFIFLSFLSWYGLILIPDYCFFNIIGILFNGEMNGKILGLV